MATEVRTVYLGTISYETSGDFTSDWTASENLGDISILGLNLYCGYNCNANYLQEAINSFGISHVYVSETGCDAQAVTSCQSDAGRAAEIKTDAVLLHKNFSSTPMYFFTWAANGSFNVPSYWAVNDEPLTLSSLK
jgi:Tfp pilus assembly protein PilV